MIENLVDAPPITEQGRQFLQIHADREALVTRGGEQITLTSTEFELLRFMMRNSKRVLSKAQILDRVWSYDFGGRSNIVELYISYLRKKIDHAFQVNTLETVRGRGYRLTGGR